MHEPHHWWANCDAFTQEEDRMKKTKAAEPRRPKRFPPQHQSNQPGREWKMDPQPQSDAQASRGSGKLRGKVALITGGDSGIGRAVAIAFAREGADVVIVYLNEHRDANETKRRVEEEGRRCLTVAGDIRKESFCRRVVARTVREFRALDILVNNAAEEHPQEDLRRITARQLRRTFETNVFSCFFMTKAAMKYLKTGGCVINTASVTAYRGSPHLMDYASTKGAIVAFTRSLAKALSEKGIRVNGVAPGPIWTPLIPSSVSAKEVRQFGSDVPLKRAGQPEEVAPCYVFLAAAQDSSYITGQVLHPNGGEVVNA
jgi:NAD(P)-dependent dehydrogenase (short-subunit alcohol dehydrogenase family)